MAIPEVRPGDEINVKVEYKNTGDEKHTFFIEVYLRHISTGTRYYAKWKSDSVPKGDVDDSKFHIDVASDWKKGQYSLSADIYEFADENHVWGQLDGISKSYVVEVI